MVTNNVRGVTVRSDLTDWRLGGCAEQTVPVTACTVAVSATPWPNQVEMNATTGTVDISFLNGKLLIANCGGLVCQYQGAEVTPPLSVSGSWTDSPAGRPARIDFMAAPMGFTGGAGGCGGGAASYTGIYDTTAVNLTLAP